MPAFLYYFCIKYVINKIKGFTIMKKYSIILIAILFAACTNSSKVPDYVIPQEDKVDIIVDIH